jgi:hypothetical protein
MLRAEPQLFGLVASDPVVSRLVARLAADAPAALRAIRSARVLLTAFGGGVTWGSTLLCWPDIQAVSQLP